MGRLHKRYGRVEEAVFPENLSRLRGSYTFNAGVGEDGELVGIKTDNGEAGIILRDTLSSEPVKTASAIALTYHGYKRTGSILWALIYGGIGRMAPLIGVPIAFAQGFGKKKEGC